MNLALRDVRRHLPRFVGTAAGLALLFAVVLSMQGIYAGMVDDATILTRAMGAELWVVQRGTQGPFAEASRLDPSVEARLAAVPGVLRSRAYTYQIIQREHRAQQVRLALVGLSWPDDHGEALPLVAGRPLAQSHGEIVVDASLGWGLGEVIPLAGEPYRVVGLTRNAVTSGGDAVAFMSLLDTHLVTGEVPDEAVQTERQRALARLIKSDLGRAQPGLSDLLQDPRWRPPILPDVSVNAVLINAYPGYSVDVLRQRIEAFGDVAVFTQGEQRELLLQGVVQRAKMQLGLFSVILTITASVIVMMVLYNMTLEKTHDLAVLRLMGAPTGRLVGVVMQQAWLLGTLGYGLAYALGTVIFPYFPRRVLLTPTILWAAPFGVFALTTLASLLGVLHATRVDPGRVLEG